MYKLYGILHRLIPSYHHIYLMEQMEYLLEAARYVTEEKLSKYQAAQFLNMNTKRFDYKVSKGEIPKGRKQVGFKEIFWYQKDLENIPKDK